MNDRIAFIANAVAKAKKVMEKVESGSYTRGHIDESKVILQNADLLEAPPAGAHVPAPQHFPQQRMQQTAVNPGTTRMPSKIAESFAKNPSFLPQGVNTMNPLAMNNFNMSQLADATKQIQGASKPHGKFTQQAQIAEHLSVDSDTALESQYEQQMAEYVQKRQQPATGYAPQQQVVQQGPVMSEDYIKFIVAETVKATVKAVMEEMSKPVSLDENIQITIGGKTFGGKIKTLKQPVVKS